MSWTWKRPFLGDPELGYEIAETDDLTPPDGEGWTLDGKFGVGKVSGAGDSPARSSR